MKDKAKNKQLDAIALKEKADLKTLLYKDLSCDETWEELWKIKRANYEKMQGIALQPGIIELEKELGKALEVNKRLINAKRQQLYKIKQDCSALYFEITYPTKDITVAGVNFRQCEAVLINAEALGWDGKAKPPDTGGGE